MNNLKRITPLMLMLASGTVLIGQETVGTLAGTVTDKAGKPLPAVQIVVSSPKMLGERTVTTDAEGKYRVPLLPNGLYTITPHKEGYASGKTRIQVLPGSVARQDLHLQAMDTFAGATVEVIATSSAVDKSETVLQTAFTQEDLSNLMNNSDLLNIAYVAPGVLLSDNDSGKTLRVRGGMPTGSKFVINGINASDPGYGNFRGDMQIIPDMIESVAVISSPLNARFGNTESGMISYVTTRGTNEWKGSIRNYYDRSTMWANAWTTKQEARFADRFGNTAPQQSIQPVDNPPSRTYEVTLSGPIWKDHITFAWGGKFKPDVTDTKRVAQHWNDIDQETRVMTQWDKNIDGVILPLPGGAQIRKADRYDMGKPYTTKESSDFNQFALFWQISNEHSIDVSYSRATNSNTGFTFDSYDLNSGMYGATKDRHEVKNIAYKGLIGPGVLEVRYGKSTDTTIVPKSADSGIITTWYANQTYTNGGYTDGANGVPGWQGSRGIGNTLEWFPFTNPIEARFGGQARWISTDGSFYDKDSSKSNESLLVNYQANVGSHLIDVGFDYEKSRWDTARDVPQQIITYMGRISRDIGANDILYPAGYSGAAINPADWAGKWVVYSPHQRIEDLWPGASTSKYVTTGTKNADGSSKYLYDMGWNARSPRMINYYGADSGTFTQPNTSLYLNDQWAINSKWSLMVGVRYDRFQVRDDRPTAVLSYSIFTPRLEVKYDIGGDQHRVVSASFGQFHNRMPSAAYSSFVHRRQPYQVIKWWEPTVDGKPYDPANPTAHPLKYSNVTAVSSEDLKNPDNYTMVMSANSPDVTRLASDFKGDVCNEYTINYQRAYDNGASLRGSIVYRKWDNNYGFFAAPKTVKPNNPYAGNLALPDSLVYELRNDSGLYHNYTGAELEWKVPFTRRLTFQGNVNYSRDLNNTDYWSPQMNVRATNNGTNGRPTGTMFTDAWAMFGVGTKDLPQHVVAASTNVNFWFSYDLGRGNVKSNLILRGNWNSGETYTNTAGYAIDVWSDAYAAAVQANNKPSDFYTSNMITNTWGDGLTHAAPGTSYGGFQYNDYLTWTVKYNLEMPITKRLSWILSFEITDPFNMSYSRNNIVGSTAYDQAPPNHKIFVDGSVPNRTFYHNGFQFDPGSLQYRGPERHIGSRSFGSIECGLRF